MHWLLALLLATALQSPNDDRCRILDLTQPPQYLTYERFSDTAADAKGGVRHVVWLRFHNNTSCSVDLRVLEAPAWPRVAVKNGDEWRVNYVVFRNYQRVLFCYGDCSDADTEPREELPPGYSAVFPVLQRHFMDGESIGVEYEYTFEAPFRLAIFGAPVITFGDGEIPRADRRRFRK